MNQSKGNYGSPCVMGALGPIGPPGLQLGMGATIYHWSDRTPTTVIQITHKGKRIVIQEDKATRTDNNGMSECQSYNYGPDPNGATYIATLRKDGKYRLVGERILVSIGERIKYHDYSF